VRLRLIKSEEEVDWLRIGAAFSDAGLASLLANTRPGMTERELGNLVERAYVGEGGTTFIHYIGVTSMADPKVFVPPQFHSARKVEKGDVVFCELSGSFWDYSGQVLRTFSVGADPTPSIPRFVSNRGSGIRRGHRRGEAWDYDGAGDRRRERDRAARLHGVRRPHARLRRRVLSADPGHTQPPRRGPLPKMTLEENMTVVVQPNVIARPRGNESPAGVQVGELIRGDEDGLRAAAQGAEGLFPRMKPVTIVGAGPVGLATALSLAHQGIPVQVIEQEPALTVDQRAGSYHPPDARDAGALRRDGRDAKAGHHGAALADPATAARA
jgi:hypothetical protein